MIEPTKGIQIILANQLVGSVFDKCSAGDPEFLERGFVCIKVCGFALLILSHFI